MEGSFELPAFRTLNDMATTIRARVNEEIFATVLARLGEIGVARLERLLVVGAGGKSEFNALKRPARRPSWSNFRRQLEHQRWVDGLGHARAWWQGVPPSKIADFAGEAASADAAVMGDYTPAKRVGLLAALVFTAQAKARDDTAEMFCRRVATLTKRSRDELEALKQTHQEITERFVVNYRSVLERIDPKGPAAAQEQAALEAARTAVAAAGGFAAQYTTSTPLPRITGITMSRWWLGISAMIGQRCWPCQRAGLGSDQRRYQRAGPARPCPGARRVDPRLHPRPHRAG